jgi:hypothetical protein
MGEGFFRLGFYVFFKMGLNNYALARYSYPFNKRQADMFQKCIKLKHLCFNKILF